MAQTRYENEEAGFSIWTYDEEPIIVYTDLVGNSSFDFLFETIEERDAFIELLLAVKGVRMPYNLWAGR